MNRASGQRLPYPGLRSFRREESDIFFGREDCINAMVDRLAATRFLAVLGTSGSGKSSVVKTGLLDALDLGLMADAGSAWRVADLRPGGAPLRNVARRLLETESEGREIADGDVALLRAFLLRGPRSITEWCADGHLPPGTNLLVLVDQFEELFRYQDYAGREEAEAFAALLLESVRQRQFPVYVVLTMRSEFLGACALVDGLAEAISTGMFLIPRLTREQCRSAIVGPAGVCGFRIEDALVTRLLNDLSAFAPWEDRANTDQRERLGRRADQLPLLQYCLNRMWVTAQDGSGDRPTLLTLADYQRIGGFEGALNAHADEVLASLGADRRPVAEAVFRALTDGATAAEAVRRPTRFGELPAICNADAAAIRLVADAFRAPGCNFLVPETVASQPKPLHADDVIDISHESLIRQWKILSQWVEAEGRARRQWRRLLDRVEDGQPLESVELANTLAWLEAQRPTAAWARRYGGDFDGALQFVRSSERQRRRFAPAVMVLLGLASLCVSFVFVLGIWRTFSTADQVPWYIFHACGALGSAATAALGLWFYAGMARNRAMTAGAVILAIIFPVGALFMTALMLKGASANTATNYWNITLAAPCLVSAIALFERSFRSLSTWLLMVVVYTVPIFIAGTLTGNPGGSVFLYVTAWAIWCAVFGSKLRGASTLLASDEAKPGFEAMKLGLLAFGLFYMNYIFGDAIWTLIYGTVRHPWPWLNDVVIYADVLAITFAFGLRRYRDLALRPAVSAGIVIFLLELVPGAAVMATLLARGVSQLQAIHWAASTTLAPGVLIGLAIFDPAFRRIAVWLPLTALFTAPYGLVCWLSDSRLISLNAGLLDLLAAATGAVWIGAIAYQLQLARLEGKPLRWPARASSSAPPVSAEELSRATP